jgi:hypothetical protein
MQRRQLLKQVGIGTVSLTSAAGVVSAGDRDLTEFKRVVRKAYKLENQEGEAAKNDFLERNDVQITSEEVSKEIPLEYQPQNEEGETGQVNPDKIQDPNSGGITVRIEGACADWVSKNTVAATLTVNYDLKAKCNYTSQPTPGAWYSFPSGGATPKDAAGIKWNDRQNKYFELADGGGESAMLKVGDVSWERDLHSPTVGKTAFRFDDLKVTNDWKDTLPNCGPTDYDQHYETESSTVRAGQCGVFLNPWGDWDPDQRVVRGTYTHAWGTLSITPSIGWGDGPVVSIGPEWQVNEAKVVTDENGDDIEVYPQKVCQTRGE